ncbi:hypothetical protein ACRAKI_23980 [Saccharothrix isguenensis]
MLSAPDDSGWRRLHVAVALLRDELARPRRHGVRDDMWSSDQVRADEELSRSCRDALAAIGAE